MIPVSNQVRPIPKAVTQYETTDGNIHPDRFHAEGHQRSLNFEATLRELLKNGDWAAGPSATARQQNEEMIVSFIMSNSISIFRGLEELMKSEVLDSSAK